MQNSLYREPRFTQVLKFLIFQSTDHFLHPPLLHATPPFYVYFQHFWEAITDEYKTVTHVTKTKTWPHYGVKKLTHLIWNIIARY